MDKSPSSSKSASDKGATGSLRCSATGTPQVRFAWSRRGTVIAGEGVDADEAEGGKYEVSDSPVDRSVNKTKKPPVDLHASMLPAAAALMQ